MMIEEFIAWRLAAVAQNGGAADWQHSWTYLPVHWTSYACQLSLRRRLPRWWGVKALNRWLDDNLRPDVPYFTVSQHDDGLSLRGRVAPSQPIFEWNCGGQGDLPLPLVCDPHERIDSPRDIRASFVGSLGNDQGPYPARQIMADALRGRKEYVVLDEPAQWGRRDDRSAAQTRRFVELMCRSVFALCPRGYGRTSYRMYEAMQLGCIPVYIYDEPWLPYAEELDWRQFAVMVPVADAPRLHDIVSDISVDRIAAMQKRLSEVYDAYFTLPGILRQILARMKTMRPNQRQTPRNLAA
jgi:hypothetical protein